MDVVKLFSINKYSLHEVAFMCESISKNLTGLLTFYRQFQIINSFIKAVTDTNCFPAPCGVCVDAFGVTVCMNVHHSVHLCS